MIQVFGSFRQTRMPISNYSPPPHYLPVPDEKQKLGERFEPIRRTTVAQPKKN